ncbi:MAG TPA: type IV toxin-antitoxin system AbiEi family antitoxin domain-containing protein [Longimicrobiaceae bacterium]|nr:type IV toxin-antitoxin system AbiEi family antitoxin domain-containing protein [Longimicrobiaceae bacterium]
MPREAYATIYELGADQLGYFTAAQAREAGVSSMALVMMERRETVERVCRGVYRLVHFPVGPLSQYMEASLWPAGLMGVISHESALALYNISDVNPSRVHITVPRSFRTRRQIPRQLVVHHADLTDYDRDLFVGIPLTSVSRTIRDCHAVHLGNEVLSRALMDAQHQGLLRRQDAEQIRKELQISPQ